MGDDNAHHTSGSAGGPAGAEDVATEFDAFDEELAEGSGPVRAFLVVRIGERAQIVDVEEGAEVTFGRASDCTVVIDDTRASRRHAVIRRVGGHMLLEDLGGKNGTKVNGAVVRASQRRIHGGDTIRIGPADIVVASAVAGSSAAAGDSRGGRLQGEIERLTRAGGGRATLVRIAVPVARAAAALDAMTELLGAMALVEARDEGEYAALLAPMEDAAVQRTLELLRRADKEAQVTLARFPEDGANAAELWDHARHVARREGGRSAQQPGLHVTDETDDESDGVVVAEPKMREVFQLARRLSGVPTTVLILGETGAGKDILAHQIHRWSPRAKGPFVRLNCASLPPTLLESELFGHERGAFTGADRRKIGYLEAAHGGTLLLDEIGEMPLGMQVKLLLVLENRNVVRLGGTQEVPVDVRILCATHRDLQAEVAAGRFREDLFYRISAFALSLPPLRERPAEIALLANVFARQFARRMGEDAPKIAPDAIIALTSHKWPGNVRELRNALEHAVVMCDEGEIRAAHLPPTVRGATASGRSLSVPPLAGDMKAQLADVERRSIEEALEAEGNNQSRAAKRLGISRRALIYKLAKYGLRK